MGALAKRKQVASLLCRVGCLMAFWTALGTGAAAGLPKRVAPRERPWRRAPWCAVRLARRTSGNLLIGRARGAGFLLCKEVCYPKTTPLQLANASSSLG